MAPNNTSRSRKNTTSKPTISSPGSRPSRIVKKNGSHQKPRDPVSGKAPKSANAIAPDYSTGTDTRAQAMKGAKTEAPVDLSKRELSSLRESKEGRRADTQSLSTRPPKSSPQTSYQQAPRASATSGKKRDANAHLSRVQEFTKLPSRSNYTGTSYLQKPRAGLSSGILGRGVAPKRQTTPMALVASNTRLSSRRVPAIEFLQFPDLPAEIRRKIWHHALAAVPAKLINIQDSIDYDDHAAATRVLIGRDLWPMTVSFNSLQEPVFFKVCTESLTEALKIYKPVKFEQNQYNNSELERTVHYNKNVDIIVFGAGSSLRTIEEIGKRQQAKKLGGFPRVAIALGDCDVVDFYDDYRDRSPNNIQEGEGESVIQALHGEACFKEKGVVGLKGVKEVIFIQKSLLWDCENGPKEIPGGRQPGLRPIRTTGLDKQQQMMYEDARRGVDDIRLAIYFEPSLVAKRLVSPIEMSGRKNWCDEKGGPPKFRFMSYAPPVAEGTICDAIALTPKMFSKDLIKYVLMVKELTGCGIDVPQRTKARIAREIGFRGTPGQVKEAMAMIEKWIGKLPNEVDPQFWGGLPFDDEEVMFAEQDAVQLMRIAGAVASEPDSASIDSKSTKTTESKKRKHDVVEKGEDLPKASKRKKLEKMRATFETDSEVKGTGNNDGTKGKQNKRKLSEIDGYKDKHGNERRTKSKLSRDIIDTGDELRSTSNSEGPKENGRKQKGNDLEGIGDEADDSKKRRKKRKQEERDSGDGAEFSMPPAVFVWIEGRARRTTRKLEEKWNEIGIKVHEVKRRWEGKMS